MLEVDVKFTQRSTFRSLVREGGVILSNRSLRPWQKSRWLAWWYFCIAVGFVLLAVRFYVLTQNLKMAIVRCAIAAGFTALGFVQLKLSRQQPPS